MMVWKNEFGGLSQFLLGIWEESFLQLGWIYLVTMSHTQLGFWEQDQCHQGFFHAPKMEESCFVNNSKNRGRKDAFSPTHF